MMEMALEVSLLTTGTDGEERPCRDEIALFLLFWLRGLMSYSFGKRGCNHFFSSDAIKYRTEGIITITDERLLTRTWQRQVPVMFI